MRIAILGKRGMSFLVEIVHEAIGAGFLDAEMSLFRPSAKQPRTKNLRAFPPGNRNNIPAVFGKAHEMRVGLGFLGDPIKEAGRRLGEIVEEWRGVGQLDDSELFIADHAAFDMKIGDDFGAMNKGNRQAGFGAE